MIKYLVVTFFLYSTAGIAYCNSDSSNCIDTIMGPLEQITKSHSDDGYSHLTLNGKEIYKAKADYMVVGESDSDGVFKGKKHLLTKATISYTSDDVCHYNKVAAYCSVKIILDLTSGKPVISNEFFADYGPSKITWVSWGKANSIIVIDDYLRFKYSNGHVEQVTKVKDTTGVNSEGK